MSMLLSVDQIFQYIFYFNALVYLAHARFSYPDFLISVSSVFSLLD